MRGLLCLLAMLFYKKQKDKRATAFVCESERNPNSSSTSSTLNKLWHQCVCEVRALMKSAALPAVNTIALEVKFPIYEHEWMYIQTVAP